MIVLTHLYFHPIDQTFEQANRATRTRMTGLDAERFLQRQIPVLREEE